MYQFIPFLSSIDLLLRSLVTDNWFGVDLLMKLLTSAVSSRLTYQDNMEDQWKIITNFVHFVCSWLEIMSKMVMKKIYLCIFDKSSCNTLGDRVS